MLNPVLREEKIKLHDWNTIPKPKLINCESGTENAWKKPKATTGLAPITWTVGDIAKAGCLLNTPPIATNFDDEQEMRRVYTLIYDVFRYKNVLNQALNDVSFFQMFTKLVSNIPHVWLLFYDLYHRSFKKRETNVAALASQLFEAHGLSFVENALWTQRVKLAASVARLRIKHNALSLSELLPPHLKDERVTEHAKNNPVTCWVNSLKTSDVKSLCKEIEDTFNLKMVTDLKNLTKNYFKWDRHCPQIIAFHSSIRPKLARSKFVRSHILIIQDKSFCLGPATFEKMIGNLELTGSVIQTHVNSPRTTAYLATLLSHNEKIKKLMAFSAGKRKTEYETYFNELGMTNVTIFSDRLIDTPADANYMEEVVAVFATPPNSFSAVLDPIDLVCSRGGDLSMLEILTESGDSNEARERVANILEEQRKTLRFAMSRPQIQFVLYETHSELEAENSCMVKKALNEINRIAKLQHAALQGKIQPRIAQEISVNLSGENQVPKDPKEINNNEEVDEVEDDEQSLSKSGSSESQSSEESINIEEQVLENMDVPETDIFDISDLPMLCPSENCNNFEKEGCYLAILQRKQIIRLDDKYMIQMAENRGLFGSNTTASTKSKTSRTTKKKQEIQENLQRPKKKFKEDQEISEPDNTINLRASSEKVDILSDYREGTTLKDTTNVITKESISRNILSQFSSAHIRQFVSPFYKQTDDALKLNKETQSRKSKAAPEKIKCIHQYFGNRKAKKSSSNDVGSAGEKRGKKMEELLARICLPTQNYLLKMLKKEESVTEARKKSAIEYAKRTFYCEQCKRRNLE